MTWRFYGRDQELDRLDEVLDRNRWAFVKISGRRRIGKTALIREALGRHKDRKSFYVQIPIRNRQAYFPLFMGSWIPSTWTGKSRAACWNSLS